MIVTILGAAVCYCKVTDNLAAVSYDRYLEEISKNGIYELFSAFRHNELNYRQFYVTGDEGLLLPRLRKELGAAMKTDSPLSHQMTSVKPEKHYNIVLFTVESLSADYMRAFGNTGNLTPNLDKLANESLFFTNLYATGTRTVYGLSALTLSIPPLPGNSIVRRPENGRLFTLGSMLRRKGYVSKFIYGGFGYFDNMNTFFGDNGYEIVDRSELQADEKQFANIWGVSDEDLFRRVLRENDKAFAEGKPFFDMVMTTSNHRPFTYPDGRIDIPSHTGREGGVKYTDYAIAQFLANARKQPWFDSTIFVIVADHTAGGAGKVELDPDKYHIPLLIYAPGIVKPGKVDRLASQIDIAPTLLGLMGMQYESRFYGRDILNNKGEGRAFISNYQQLGYMTDDRLVVLKPVKQKAFFKRDGAKLSATEDEPDLLNEALGYYQSATYWKTWNRDMR